MRRKPRLRKKVDEVTQVSCTLGRGVIREEVWVNSRNAVARYNLAFINHQIHSGDNGRVLGYDNRHGQHHRHLMGKQETVAFRSYEIIRPMQAQSAQEQYNLGSQYFEGKSVPQNLEEAARLYRLAADQGHSLAQTRLGQMYEGGHGVSQDYSEAASLYRLAAEQGEAAAQYDLGVMYKYGRGVPQDYNQAFMWFSLADAGGYASATVSKAEVSRLLTPEGTAEATRLARATSSRLPRTDGRRIGLVARIGCLVLSLLLFVAPIYGVFGTFFLPIGGRFGTFAGWLLSIHQYAPAVAVLLWLGLAKKVWPDALRVFLAAVHGHNLL